MFIVTLDMHYAEKLPVMLDEIESLHAAIIGGDQATAERLWREKFERWVRDFIEHLPDEEFDVEMWLALTAGAS